MIVFSAESVFSGSEEPKIADDEGIRNGFSFGFVGSVLGGSANEVDGCGFDFVGGWVGLGVGAMELSQFQSLG